MSAWVVISVYRNDLEIIGVSFNFPLFFECVDGSLFGKSAVIWIESMGDLGDIVGVCNVVCVGGCWWGRGDVAGVKIE